VPGIVLAWRRGERQTAIQALVLLLAAIGIDALGVRRGLEIGIFCFTDPLIILAGAILLDRNALLSVSQMAYRSPHAGRPAPRHRSRRAGEIRAQARRPGTGLRMETGITFRLLPLPCASRHNGTIAAARLRDRAILDRVGTLE